MRMATRAGWMAAVAMAMAMALGMGMVLAIACTGCSSDAGSSVSALERRSGGFGGSGSPAVPSSNDPGEDGSGASPPHQGSTPSPVVHPPDAGGSAPVGGDAGTTPGSGTTAVDAGAATGVGGCANGCADGCLTLAINFCKTATADFQDFCSQVPVACACNATGTPPPTPSLQQCIADIESADPNAGDDTTN